MISKAVANPTIPHPDDNHIHNTVHYHIIYCLCIQPELHRPPAPGPPHGPIIPARRAPMADIAHTSPSPSRVFPWLATSLPPPSPAGSREKGPTTPLTIDPHPPISMPHSLSAHPSISPSPVLLASHSSCGCRVAPKGCRPPSMSYVVGPFSSQVRLSQERQETSGFSTFISTLFLEFPSSTMTSDRSPASTSRKRSRCFT